jgi:hypothetical protein
MSEAADYTEMMAHHIATVICFLYSYFVNTEDFAIFILLSSDFGDFYLSTSRVLSDADMNINFSKCFEYSVFTGLLLVWIYTRLIVLPFCFYKGIWRFLPFKGHNPVPGHVDMW